MSHNRIRFDGLDELRTQLRQLPAHLTDEAKGIVTEAMEDARRDVVRGYPQGPTGNLRRMVSIVRQVGGQFVTGGVLRNRAPHAYMFEHGTQVRHTNAGINRGRMPPGRVWIPAMIRHRRRMYERLKALLTREGLTVSGDA